MKKILFIAFIFSMFICNVSANNYIEKTVMGHKLRAIKYDNRNDDYIFKVGVNPDYGASDLRSLMEKNNGISAVNGAFFCPADYTECRGQDFTENERYFKGYKIGLSTDLKGRVTFAITKDGKPFLFQSGAINAMSEGKIYYGISNFPLLLRDGVSTYDDYVEMGLIDSKMKYKANRNFICSDILGNMIYTGYVSSIELSKLPEVLLDFGCYNALNLDAGASSSMIYNGKQIIGPGRDILDGIVIERKGLDIEEFNQLGKYGIDAIRKKIKSYDINEKISMLNDIGDSLSVYRTNIYEKNSKDVYDKEGKKDGYEIEIKSLNTLKKVYLINYLIVLIADLKKEFIAEEEARIQEEIDENNRQNGLF